MEQEYKYMVCTSCMTFNHAPFIVDAMNGFVMQETTFPAYYLITDDASTDGEQEVIRQYLSEHFQKPYRTEETDDYHLFCAVHKSNPNCIFVVFFLKYNHYSIKKPKLPYQSEWRDNAKYIAICEGDDYWIHPKKLQTQVSYLENHSQCTMVCNRTKLYSVKRNDYIGECYCYKSSQFVEPKDVIKRGGLFVSTCSMLFREWIADNKPNYWKNCKVGDYPLQIMCAMKGYIYYFNDIMSVYRVENPSSWMGQQRGNFTRKRFEVVKSMIEMFEGYGKDYPQYRSDFDRKIASYINQNVPTWCFSKEHVKEYLSYFSKETNNYSLKWKLDLWTAKLRIPKIRACYNKLFMAKYDSRIELYPDK